MPRQRFDENLRPYVVRPPALEQPRVQVVDPILRQVSLVLWPLHDAIVAPTAWGQHLGGEHELTSRHLLGDPPCFGAREDEDIGLTEELGLELDVERRGNGKTDA